MIRRLGRSSVSQHFPGAGYPSFDTSAAADSLAYHRPTSAARREGGRSRRGDAVAVAHRIGFRSKSTSSMADISPLEARYIPFQFE